MLLLKHQYLKKAPKCHRVGSPGRREYPCLPSEWWLGCISEKGLGMSWGNSLSVQTKLEAKGERTSSATVSRTSSLSWGPCLVPGEPRVPNKPPTLTGRLTRRWLCPAASSGLARQGWVWTLEPCLNLKREQESGQSRAEEGGVQEEGPCTYGL